MDCFGAIQGPFCCSRFRTRLTLEPPESLLKPALKAGGEGRNRTDE